MKFVNYTYSPRLNLKISAQEVDRLLQCSHHHYDGSCRMASQPGGMLWGMLNSVISVYGTNPKTGEYPDADAKNPRVPTECLHVEIEAHLETGDVDLLAKITEQEGAAFKGDEYMGLTFELSNLLKAASREYERINNLKPLGAVPLIQALQEGRTLRNKKGTELYLHEDGKLIVSGFSSAVLEAGTVLQQVLKNPSRWEILEKPNMAFLASRA